MQFICLTVLSSHYRLLVVPRDPAHLAAFMGFVNTGLSKELGRLHSWRGTFFADRYHHVEVSDEEADQVRRLKYCLANSVKEFLVDRLAEWPGVHSAEALVSGQPPGPGRAPRTGLVSSEGGALLQHCRGLRAPQALHAAASAAPAGRRPADRRRGVLRCPRTAPVRQDDLLSPPGVGAQQRR